MEVGFFCSAAMCGTSKNAFQDTEIQNELESPGKPRPTWTI